MRKLAPAHMKLFLGVLVTLNIVALRLLDFLMTRYLAPDLDGERNVLTVALGLQWSGLLLVNAIVVLVLAALFFLYLFRHERYLPREPGLDLASFCARYYFGRPEAARRILWRMPHDLRILAMSLGFSGILSLMLVSVLINASYLVGLAFAAYRPVHNEWVNHYPVVLAPFALLTHALFFVVEYWIYTDRHRGRGVSPAPTPT